MSVERYRMSDGSITESASEFRDHCMKLVDELMACGGSITITTKDQPGMRLAALGPPQSPPWGFLKDVEITGDIMSPIFTDAELDEFVEREVENIYGRRADRTE